MGISCGGQGRQIPSGSIICIRFTGYNLSLPNGQHPFAMGKDKHNSPISKAKAA